MIFSRFKWNRHTILELDQPKVAYIYYRTTRLNLMTGFPETYPFEKFLEKLNIMTLQQKVNAPLVFHFYYEFGLFMSGLGHTVDEDAPLVVEIEYQRVSKRKPRKSCLTHLPLRSLERPTWTEYRKAFERVQTELLSGNCYQVNLTYPFDFETAEIFDPTDIADFFFSRLGLAAYAHATYLGEEMILSNSPECLFQYERDHLFTMPIKGTLKRDGNVREQWQKMLSDPKEEGELFMITDLLKNDLNRIDLPRAQVKKLRAPLLVPGLLHQYSLIDLKLHNLVSVKRVLEALFPGGSITGAPKMRVMEIIQGVERFQRGIYCGSTLLCYGSKKVASINIRTASINVGERLWRYGAGGGVTLLSKPVDEFQEMEAKVSSFLTFLKTPGYGP